MSSNLTPNCIHGIRRSFIIQRLTTHSPHRTTTHITSLEWTTRCLATMQWTFWWPARWPSRCCFSATRMWERDSWTAFARGRIWKICAVCVSVCPSEARSTWRYGHFCSDCQRCIAWRSTWRNSARPSSPHSSRAKIYQVPGHGMVECPAPTFYCTSDIRTRLFWRGPEGLIHVQRNSW